MAEPIQRIGAVRIDRRIEVVAERGAERLLEALVDRDGVHHRRPQVLGLDRQHLGQRLGFGLQPLHAPLGLGERVAGRFQFLARGRVRGLGFERGRFSGGDGGLYFFDRLRQ